jgi:hypothetical protein
MSYTPRSLAQLFAPPDEYRGIFGWVCGYSADAGFMENAVERFSGLTQAQRAHQGRIMLALLLDPGNPQLLPTEVPGVLHLPATSPGLPFLLLHAKVAILGFQRQNDFLLRVIVTTGNWTRQTLEESLDLAWHIDVANGEDGKTTEDARQERTDLAAAWSFLLWVREFFDTRSLELGKDAGNESASAAEALEAWAARLGRRHRGYRPRFFDNRDASLLSQLPELVRVHAGTAARNYLAVGSGFYESAGSGAPVVPENIVAQLLKAGLVTASCGKDMFVNPRGCQSVAVHRAWIEERGWTIRAANVPCYFRAATRALHAKFIFSANARGDSNNCSSPWLYLGSGNLTTPGFRQKAGSTGNLEAGAVIAPVALKREAARDVEDADIVTNRLPIHWEDESVPLPTLQPGEDMVDRGVVYTAAPVALLLWQETPHGGRLSVVGHPTGPFQILDPDGQPCEALEVGGFAWRSARPRLVAVAWSTDGAIRTAHVPVIDHYGRFAAAAFPPIDLEEAWIQLANFPMPPDDEELTGGDAIEGVDGVEAASTVTQGNASGYPIRRMMTLIEDIAAKQADIAQADWMTWCNRLEQVLVQSKESAVVAAFQALGFNPLAPLLEKSFRPAFAIESGLPECARYEAALQRVIEAWKLKGTPALGELP